MDELIIVLATKNQGKAKEIKALLAGEPVKIMDLTEFGPMPEAREDSDTFEDNAYFKALHYARVLGFPALADDSGLSVEALGGRPGVHSARWAGENATDKDRVDKLLAEMKTMDNRKAEFVCALVLAIPSGPGLTWVGTVEGEIAREPQGENGFGYDPVFYYAPLGKTFAQISRDEKNKISHRGKALTEFIAEFDKVLVWLKQRQQEVEAPHHH